MAWPHSTPVVTSHLILLSSVVIMNVLDADELQELRDLVKQLQADNERLRQKQSVAEDPREGGSSQDSDGVSMASGASQASGGASVRSGGPHNGLSTPGERILYLPRERKCPIFRGSTGIGINDWVEEVQASMRARYLSPLDQAYFIYDHLEGEAKEEIRYRSQEEKENPDTILNILQELYGCSKSYVALQENFFSRRQLDGETLQEYSHALFCLMEKVTKSAPGVLQNAAILLRDQFVEYVLDPCLRRELKRLVRLNPGYTLLDVRREAIRWEQEGQPSDARGRSQSVPSYCAVQHSQIRREGFSNKPQDGIAEIRELLVKQQEQINLLTQNMLQLQNRPPSYNRGGPIICRQCQRPGHIARNCRQQQYSQSAGQPLPPQGQAISASQQAEN